ncbi:MAG: glycosyltransferase family 39 protein [Pseudomonadota bacterium]
MTSQGRGQYQPPLWGHIVLIAIFAVIVGLSGLLTVPPLDRDESRFIQASTQMMETGDYVRIKYQNEERNKKPVGIYWLQAASVQALADVEDRPLWAYRMPSLLGAMLAAVFTYLAGCTLFGRSAAFMGAMLLAAAPVVAGEASIAKTDAVLLATICAMQAALARVILAPPDQSTTKAALGFWIAIGIGLLIKGPITPMVGVFTVAGVALISWRKGYGVPWWPRLKLGVGIAIVLLITLPWAIGIGIATEGRFFEQALGTDMLGKVTSSQERHGGPPGYHFLAFWAMFWPAALMVLPALRRYIPLWGSLPVAFCLSWFIPTWIVFELTSTKLPHYPMVVYPALALLIGAFVAAPPKMDTPWLRRISALIYFLVGVGAALGMVTLAVTYSTQGAHVGHYIAAVVIIIASGFAAIQALRLKRVEAMRIAIVASAVFVWVTFEGVLPTLDRLLLTPRLAEMLDAHEAHPLRDDTGPVALVGYHEPSAVFTLGTDTKLLGPQEAAVWITTANRRAVVVEDRLVDDFLMALPKGRDAEAISSIEGFNYSNNKDMKLTLYRLK